MDDATLLSNNAAIIKNPYFIVLPNAGINNVTIKSIGMIKIIVLKIILNSFLAPIMYKIKNCDAIVHIIIDLDSVNSKFIHNNEYIVIMKNFSVFLFTNCHMYIHIDIINITYTPCAIVC